MIQGALIAVGVMVFFLLIRAGANRPARRDPKTGELVLQCAPGLAWTMGAIAVGGPVGMGLLAFVIPARNAAEAFVPLVIGLFFLLLGGMMCWWALARRTRLSDKGLTSEYMFVKPRFIPWDEVEKLNFSSGQEFWVISETRQKAMLHVWFVGVKEAVPMLEQYLPEEVMDKYDSVLWKFARTVGVEAKG